MHHIEIDQKTDAFLAKLQVREQLRLVQRQQCVDGLYFDDYFVFNEKVDSVSKVQQSAVVFEEKKFLRFKPDMLFFKLPAQAHDVGALEETGTKFGMDSVSSAEYGMRDVFVNQQGSIPSMHHGVLRGCISVRKGYALI